MKYANYCEIDLIQKWCTECAISSAGFEVQASTFAINDTTFYISVVTLSTKDKAKLLEQLKSGLRKKILTGIRIIQKTDPSFQGIETFFFSSF